MNARHTAAPATAEAPTLESSLPLEWTYTLECRLDGVLHVWNVNPSHTAKLANTQETHPGVMNYPRVAMHLALSATLADNVRSLAQRANIANHISWGHNPP